MSGLSEVLRSYHVEAAGHQGFPMDAGEIVRFTDLQGQQPIDFWAFNREDMSEYMSAAHSRRSVCRFCSLWPSPAACSATAICNVAGRLAPVALPVRQSTGLALNSP